MLVLPFILSLQKSWNCTCGLELVDTICLSERSRHTARWELLMALPVGLLVLIKLYCICRLKRLHLRWMFQIHPVFWMYTIVNLCCAKPIPQLFVVVWRTFKIRVPQWRVNLFGDFAFYGMIIILSILFSICYHLVLHLLICTWFWN